MVFGKMDTTGRNPVLFGKSLYSVAKVRTTGRKSTLSAKIDFICVRQLYFRFLIFEEMGDTYIKYEGILCGLF